MIDFDTTVLAGCMEVFGQSVTFLPQAGPALTIAGIFTEEYQELEFGDGNPEASTQPVLGCRASAFNGNLPLPNDRFAFRGVTWAVNKVDPDGEGHLQIKLRRADNTQLGLVPGPPIPPPPQ